eukprot:CAMPEP_0117028450 /NCGR_PEP_ID=MMETSP0472-20121206/20682_1 /TAXON_ID=693140 ORGANISM="Tiarina fusus, Strain LIS" /NCGR_SAMPLE_ID=MMETSP0472 /ASSEMBLY_ACC=CAM_ASM_000603 /LENGTH=101 /DNA_ID=CAMNT_0004735935 /DNA_START=444 /DNA_END=752 /DNA_ORIENTATION=+
METVILRNLESHLLMEEKESKENQSKSIGLMEIQEEEALTEEEVEEVLVEEAVEVVIEEINKMASVEITITDNKMVLKEMDMEVIISRIINNNNHIVLIKF